MRYLSKETQWVSLFYGKAQGPLPTGSAVMGDIIEIGKVIAKGASYDIRAEDLMSLYTMERLIENQTETFHKFWEEYSSTEKKIYSNILKIRRPPSQVQLKIYRI